MTLNGQCVVQGQKGIVMLAGGFCLSQPCDLADAQQLVCKPPASADGVLALGRGVLFMGRLESCSQGRGARVVVAGEEL